MVQRSLQQRQYTCGRAVALLLLIRAVLCCAHVVQVGGWSASVHEAAAAAI
jgi:hypothetical protein